MSNINKTIEIFAGPNGCGKTTLSELLLGTRSGPSPITINADVIAQGLGAGGSMTVNMEAGRVMLRRISECLREERSFAFETTLSGRMWIRLLNEAKNAGYKVIIYYFVLDNVELAIKRIANRVSEGGHAVPEDVVRRRFQRSKCMFLGTYSTLAERYYIFDNSQNKAILLAKKEENQIVVIAKERYNKIFTKNMLTPIYK